MTAPVAFSRDHFDWLPWVEPVAEDDAPALEQALAANVP